MRVARRRTLIRGISSETAASLLCGMVGGHVSRAARLTRYLTYYTTPLISTFMNRKDERGSHRWT